MKIKQISYAAENNHIINRSLEVLARPGYSWNDSKGWVPIPGYVEPTPSNNSDKGINVNVTVNNPSRGGFFGSGGQRTPKPPRSKPAPLPKLGNPDDYDPETDTYFDPATKERKPADFSIRRRYYSNKARDGGSKSFEENLVDIMAWLGETAERISNFSISKATEHLANKIGNKLNSFKFYMVGMPNPFDVMSILADLKLHLYDRDSKKMHTRIDATRKICEARGYGTTPVEAQKMQLFFMLQNKDRARSMSEPQFFGHLYYVVSPTRSYWVIAVAHKKLKRAALEAYSYTSPDNAKAIKFDEGTTRTLDTGESLSEHLRNITKPDGEFDWEKYAALKPIKLNNFIDRLMSSLNKLITLNYQLGRTPLHKVSVLAKHQPKILKIGYQEVRK